MTIWALWHGITVTIKAHVIKRVMFFIVEFIGENDMQNYVKMKTFWVGMWGLNFQGCLLYILIFYWSLSFLGNSLQSWFIRNNCTCTLGLLHPIRAHSDVEFWTTYTSNLILSSYLKIQCSRWNCTVTFTNSHKYCRLNT